MRRARSWALSVVLAGALSACGGPHPPEGAPTAPAPAPSAASASAASAAAADAAPPSDTSAAPVAAPTPPKPLAPSATFRDLVAAVRGAGATHATGGCILGGSVSGPFTLATYDGHTDLADPPADIDALLEQPTRGGFDTPGVAVIADWGATEGGDYLDLVALSPVPKSIRSAPTPVIFATDKGLYLGLVGRGSDGKRLEPSTIARIKGELVPKAKIWIVAAEGDAPLSRLREALALIADTKGTVVLASPAPRAAPLRPRVSRYDSKVEKGTPDACDLEAMGGVVGVKVGNYKMDTLMRVAQSVERAGKRCGDALPAGQGGAINVMVRIARDGHIEKACAETDDLGDESVRSCLMSAVRKTKFPAPDEKRGVVPFGTAVLFIGKPVKALCE